jgi:hypothetical protein
MKSLIISLTSVAVTGEILSAQEKTHVEIAGFSFGKKDPESQFGQGLSITKQPGLETDVFFRLPGRTILSIDEKQPKITLTTNEGKQLPLEEFFDGFFRWQSTTIRQKTRSPSGVLSFRQSRRPIF